ncbi:putative F-box/LRR-repeat protein At4g13960 [Lycium ferocissimum]|uniref:putative F-box/LRR-repeat protein At4g13960 n=1 Tax=Lycium ferocissimum TaxID=112874 RepID=UPI002815EA1E|nr:putative F-box/LRR-repeat protein At4g13960 [Lycium ferocissimum]
MVRISKLPTEILHQIPSLLSTKTAARTSVLSKLWLKACSTNPYLCFDQSDFGEDDLHSEFLHFHCQLLRVVDNTLERYRRENLPISAFKLCISFSNHTDCDGLVDKWLDIVAEKRVSRVALLVRSRSRNLSERYTLLADTIFAIKSLQQLELDHCKILKQKALLSKDKIKCSNLKNLTLRYVTVTESYRRLPIEEVHISDTPNLLSFEYVNKGNLEPSSVKICLRTLNIGTCQNLRGVEFVNTEIDDTVLFELIQKLHFIKELILHCCKCLKKIKISSSTLEVCSLAMCDLLVRAIFDVPKLLSLVVSEQYGLPSLSFVSASSQCRISINYGALWYIKQCIHLQRSLVELHHQVVDLTLSSMYVDEGMRSISRIDHLPISEVERLILYPDIFGQTYSSYFDVIFSICWPKSLTVHCDQKFREFLQQQLLKKRQRRFTKCTWKEYLINAHVEYKKEIEDDWVTLDRNMLRSNPRFIEEIHTIRFKQTQRKEKNNESSISR